MRQRFEDAGRLISYLDVRPTAPRQAGTLVLLHAFPLAADMWQPQLADALSSWRVIAPDLRGFGGSSPDDTGGQVPSPEAPFSIEDLAGDVLSLLDHLRISTAVVCGLSMGGYVAFAIHRLAPQRLRGLVLADTRPDPDTEAGREGRRGMLATLARDGTPAVAEAMLPRLLGRTSHASRPDLVERVRTLIVAQPAPAVGAAIVRLMTRPDSTATLGAIDCPVLIVAGEEDEITGPEVARQMHGQVAGAELALIRHAGHLSSMEEPGPFNMALDRFLATRFILP